MVFNGFSVDNIWGFRRYFSMKELIGAIENPFILMNWFPAIEASGGLNVEEKTLIAAIFQDFNRMSHGIPCDCWENINDISANNFSLTQKFQKWLKNVCPEQVEKYKNFCGLILRFLVLGEFTVSEDSEEEAVIFNYLIEESYIKIPLLKLERNSTGKAGIYYGSTLVTEVDASQSGFCDSSLVCVACHPDTGYIGINEEGKIINRSAFFIPPSDAKAVKAVINQAAYVILLENGKIIHNLKFTDLPEAPVKNIELHGEQLMWQFMDSQEGR